MSISTTTARVSYAGDDSSTEFSVPFAFLDEEYLTVLLVDADGVSTEQTLTTHYTVTGDGDEPGGTLTMVTAPATGETLVIIGEPEHTQELELDDTGALPISTLERAFDKLTRICTRLKDSIDRTIRLSDGFTADFDLELPSDLAADQVIGVNGTGDGLVGIAVADLGVPIGSLTPVNITSPSNGQALIYNGTEWVNSTQSTTAGNVSSTPSGNLAASDVQTALDELQTDIDTRALDSDLDAHTGALTGAHNASAITNTPSGNLAATNVQAALDELQTDVDTRALDSDLDTHTAATAAHGVTGDVVGTTDTQTLTNKTLIDPVIDVVNLTDQAASPAAPAVGTTKLYTKTDGKLYKQDSSGTETEVGAGGSGGGGALVVTGSRGTPQAITAAGGIAFTGSDARQLWFVEGSGGPVTVTANPQIAAATTVGQELTLVGRSDANPLTLSNGTGIELNGGATLGESDVLKLIWDGTAWIEQSRSF